MRSTDPRMAEALASVLGARRDGTATAESARSLLMTVLGEFVLPSGGSAWTQTLIASLESLDVKEKAARQTLARMESDGWLVRERIGRRTRWTLTSRARRLLEEGAERIYGVGQGSRVWDGEWVLLLASVPETERATRYRMTQQLSWIGFGTLGQGTWICPWSSQERAARDALSELDVESTSFRGRIGMLGSGPELASRAWRLDDLASAYEAFLEEFPASVSVSSPAEAASLLNRVVHAWRRFPFLDPDLPAPLLPADWPGARAAKRFASVRSGSLDSARQWWEDEERNHA